MTLPIRENSINRLITQAPAAPQGVPPQQAPAGDIAHIVSAAVDGVVMPPIRNFNVQNPQTVRVIVHVNETPSCYSSFLRGAATSAGGTITAIVIYKSVEIIVGAWRGAVTGGAVGGPPGAVAGAFIGGTVGLIV